MSARTDRWNAYLDARGSARGPAGEAYAQAAAWDDHFGDEMPRSYRRSEVEDRLVGSDDRDLCLAHWDAAVEDVCDYCEMPLDDDAFGVEGGGDYCSEKCRWADEDRARDDAAEMKR